MGDFNDKHSVQIDGKLYAEIKEYCQLNKLKLNSFIDSILKKAFSVEKYGDKPFIIQQNTVENSRTEYVTSKKEPEIIETKKEENSDDIYNVEANLKQVQTPVESKKKVTKLR